MLPGGVDPSDQKRANKLATTAARGNTFAVIAAELLEKNRCEGRAKVTLHKLEWLHGIACEEIGTRPVAEIAASEVLLVLKCGSASADAPTAARHRHEQTPRRRSQTQLKNLSEHDH